MVSFSFPSQVQGNENIGIALPPYSEAAEIWPGVVTKAFDFPPFFPEKEPPLLIRNGGVPSPRLRSASFSFPFSSPSPFSSLSRRGRCGDLSLRCHPATEGDNRSFGCTADAVVRHFAFFPLFHDSLDRQANFFSFSFLSLLSIERKVNLLSPPPRAPWPPGIFPPSPLSSFFPLSENCGMIVSNGPASLFFSGLLDSRL